MGIGIRRRPEPARPSEGREEGEGFNGEKENNDMVIIHKVVNSVIVFPTIPFQLTLNIVTSFLVFYT